MPSPLPLFPSPWHANSRPTSRPKFDPRLCFLETVLWSQLSLYLSCPLHDVGLLSICAPESLGKRRGRGVRLLAALSCALQLFDIIFNSELNWSHEGLP